jgi:hypothetical protein
MMWRAAHGHLSMAGLRDKTRMLTEPWDALPAPLPSIHDESVEPIWAFFFHPEDLHDRGISHGLKNLARLGKLPGARFVRASDVL